MFIGTMLVVVGLVHLAVGGVLYAEPLAEVAREGVLNRVPDFGDRAAALWFLITGVCFLVLGACVRDGERRALPLPAPLAPGLLLLAFAIVIPMPASGAWIFLPIAWLAQRRLREARQLR